MYQPAKIPEVEALMSQARNQSGTSMVPTSAKGVKALYKHLKQGGTTVILADQEPPKQSGQFAPFFNVPALTQTLVPRLIQQTQAQALMIFTLRGSKRATFDVHIQAVDPDIYSPNLTAATHALNRSIECAISEAVEQYQWGYKRFKHQPDNHTPSLYNH